MVPPTVSGRLRVVDTETGEIHGTDCPSCQALTDQVAGLQTELHAWRARYANLKRDRDQAARTDELWPLAVELFGEWKVACNHPNSKWTTDRFELVRPLLKKYGADRVRQAIAGAAFDPFVTVRKNGSCKRHDDWGLLFRDATRFEEFCCRAPRDRQS